MLKFRFEPNKAISALLFISSRLIERSRVAPVATPDIHRISKILYFADQKHLTRYGRPILGDVFVAMENGPVPSQTYDMIKAVRGNSLFCKAADYDQFFEVKGYMIKPKQAPDLDELSESDLACIEESLQENQDLSFNDLKLKSHDSAYESATRNDQISFLRMARAGGADREMLAYITSVSNNQSRSHGE